MHDAAFMKKLFGKGYDSGDILKGWDDPVTARENRFCGGDYKALFIDLIQPHLVNAQNVLEIGPGKGSWTKAALKHMQSGTLHAVDILPMGQFIQDAVVPTTAAFRFYQIEDSDYALFDDSFFDFVFTIGVFVHLTLEEIDHVLKKLRPKIKKNRRLVVHYSNWDKLDSYGWEKGGVPVQFKKMVADPEMWWKKNNCGAMASVIENAGFKVVNIDTNHLERDSIAILSS